MANREESMFSTSHTQLPIAPGSDSDWLPLLDYAMKTGLSLSTLRRYIKANKVEYKVERGRYMLRMEPAMNQPAGAYAFSAEAASSPSVTAKLQNDLQRAKEEIAELKTLIAFYEERMSRGNVSRDS